MSIRTPAGRAARGRSRPLRPEVVAAWCDDLARRVRSGDSLAAALREAVVDDPALDRATNVIRLALDRGASVAEAVQPTSIGTPGRSIDATVPGLQHLALARSVIAVAATVGGSAAAPLDRVAAALRLRAVDRDDRLTQAAQARMSAQVLTVVPVLMLAVLATADADVRAAVASGAGGTCVALGLLLNGCGWWWMRRIVQVPQ